MSYKKAIEKWTRDGKVYENFETNLIIKATFKSEEFRESYIEEYSNIFMLDGEKLQKLVNEERGAIGKYLEFFLAIHTPDKEWSDVEKKDPIWAIYLMNDTGEKTAPIEVKRLKEKGPNASRFYPYLDDWSTGYAVKFPLVAPEGNKMISEDISYFKVIITGSPGRGELVWEIKKQ